MTNLRDQLQASLGESYTLERELGGGGMSRVYVAREKSLGREVVLKVIRPEMAEGLSAERFAREVKLAARLQQANIVPLLAAGTAAGLSYYTMPFVRGESLRVRLGNGTPVSIPEAVGILRDVARALAYAHVEGVVHRDIKPENILLSGGAAVVLDFGIAKALSASRTQHDILTTGLTQVGTSLGTPGYMAPEQALGDITTDHRADIYALGVVAWELLAGAHPFAGRGSMQALIAAHVTETPASLATTRPDVPAPLAALVMRCLEKDPALRPASATELLASLESAATPGALASAPSPSRRGRRGVIVAALFLFVLIAGLGYFLRSGTPAASGVAEKSLAVLPFRATGGDTADAYLAEGIADEVNSTLAQLPGLRVAGRSSSARFAGKGATAQEIGKALDVAAVLDGTVRRVGEQIRVSVELTRAADGVVLWHENYERAATDIFAVQDEIARAIGGQLQVALAGSGVVRGTSDGAAYELYLKGMYLYRRRGEDLTAAISSFEQAIARDSTFARAWAGLASALLVSPYFLDMRMGAVLPRAHAAAERAVQLDSMSSEAHLAFGFALAESFDYVASEREIQRGIALDPHSAEAHYRLGWLLLNTGWPDKAIPALQQAKAIDPLFFLPSTYLGWAQINQGLLAEGVAEEHRGAELEPQNLAALSLLAVGYARTGHADSAVAVTRRFLPLTQSPLRLGMAAFALARGGERKQAEALIRRIGATPHTAWTRWTGLAIGYAGLGDVKRAIDAMEHAAASDGDLLVSFATLLSGELPPDPRVDAVYRRFHLDPARFANRTAPSRP
jgi:serine/threonine-protein kinase